MNRSHLLCLLLVLAGCSTPSLRQAGATHTLAGNPRIPAPAIARFFGGAEWDRIRNSPYDAFVILRGSILPDHRIKIIRIVESYPDDSRDDLAREFSREARLTPMIVGSHVLPTAEVYVIFYETGRKPRQVLIFADQFGNSAPSVSNREARYLSFGYY